MERQEKEEKEKEWRQAKQKLLEKDMKERKEEKERMEIAQMKMKIAEDKLKDLKKTPLGARAFADIKPQVSCTGVRMCVSALYIVRTKAFQHVSRFLPLLSFLLAHFRVCV